MWPDGFSWHWLRWFLRPILRGPPPQKWNFDRVHGILMKLCMDVGLMKVHYQKKFHAPIPYRSGDIRVSSWKTGLSGGQRFHHYSTCCRDRVGFIWKINPCCFGWGKGFFSILLYFIFWIIEISKIWKSKVWLSRKLRVSLPLTSM